MNSSRFTSRPAWPKIDTTASAVTPTAVIARVPYSHMSSARGNGIPSAVPIARNTPEASIATTSMIPHLTSSTRIRDRWVVSRAMNRGPYSAGRKPRDWSTMVLTIMPPVNPARISSSV